MFSFGSDDPSCPRPDARKGEVAPVPRSEEDRVWTVGCPVCDPNLTDPDLRAWWAAHLLAPMPPRFGLNAQVRAGRMARLMATAQPPAHVSLRYGGQDMGLADGNETHALFDLEEFPGVLAAFRHEARAEMADRLAPWVADGLPVALWPRDHLRRCCPKCGHADMAEAFKADLPAAFGGDGGARRICPACGFAGPSVRFMDPLGHLTDANGEPIRAFPGEGMGRGHYAGD
jgi:hypothetical protein